MKEMVLYYNPKAAGHTAKLKGVLVRMGVRIKNIAPDQVIQKVGYLAGIPGYEEEVCAADTEIPVIEEEILVMKNFTGRRIDELLLNLRRAGVPKIDLKAIVTESNCSWTFYHLYEEIKEEHRAMAAPQ